jgi:hypothetical protein
LELWALLSSWSASIFLGLPLPLFFTETPVLALSWFDLINRSFLIIIIMLAKQQSMHSLSKD